MEGLRVNAILDSLVDGISNSSTFGTFISCDITTSEGPRLNSIFNSLVNSISNRSIVYIPLPGNNVTLDSMPSIVNQHSVSDSSSNDLDNSKPKNL